MIFYLFCNAFCYFLSVLLFIFQDDPMGHNMAAMAGPSKGKNRVSVIKTEGLPGCALCAATNGTKKEKSNWKTKISLTWAKSAKKDSSLKAVLLLVQPFPRCLNTNIDKHIYDRWHKVSLPLIFNQLW